jgi:hypothetical protein
VYLAIRAFPNNILNRQTPQRRLSILPTYTELPLGLKLLKGAESTKRTQDLAVDLMLMNRLLVTFVSSLANNNVMRGYFIAVVHVVALSQLIRFGDEISHGSSSAGGRTFLRFLCGPETLHIPRSDTLSVQGLTLLRGRLCSGMAN